MLDASTRVAAANAAASGSGAIDLHFMHKHTHSVYFSLNDGGHSPAEGTALRLIARRKTPPRGPYADLQVSAPEKLQHILSSVLNFVILSTWSSFACQDRQGEGWRRSSTLPRGSSVVHVEKTQIPNKATAEVYCSGSHCRLSVCVCLNPNMCLISSQKT